MTAIPSVKNGSCCRRGGRGRKKYSQKSRGKIGLSTSIALAFLISGDVSALTTTGPSNKVCGTDAGTDARLNLDEPRLLRSVRSGRPYHHRNFITETEVRTLLREVQSLKDDGSLVPSGLSDTSRNEQGFDPTRDRATAPVPWFADALLSESSSSSSYRVAATDAPDTARGVLAPKLQSLRRRLSSVLDRPTMVEPSLAHECYYSVSNVGSSLPRHLDESHEETKGARGWLNPCRRSVSWLIYLSDENWDGDTNGGCLRTFPQRDFNPVEGGAVEAGTHEGNLQVGWISRGTKTSPVYLDSWYFGGNRQGGGEDVAERAAEEEPPSPTCVLYSVDELTGLRTDITRPFVAEDALGVSLTAWMTLVARIESGDAETELSVGQQSRQKLDEEQKMEAIRPLFVRSDDARNFHPIEDRAAWNEGKDPHNSEIVEVVPERGSLLLFDSVSLPHEVMPVLDGSRVALAGWFHEKTQEFPESYGDLEW